MFTQCQPILLLDLSLRCTGYAVVQWPAHFRPDGRWETPLAQQIGPDKPFGEFKVERSDLSIQERVGMVSLLIDGLVNLYKPQCVAAEMPQHMFQGSHGRSVSNSQSALMQQRVFGAVSALLWMRGMPFLEIDPTLSKAALTGKKGASKNDVRFVLGWRLGFATHENPIVRFPKGWTEAVRDALAVGFYLQNRYEVYGQDWLEKTLEQQHKPELSQWRDWRIADYGSLLNELQTRHRKH